MHYPKIVKHRHALMHYPNFQIYRIRHCIKKNTEYWKQDKGYWIQDTGDWILDTGYWILDTGYRILDTRY